MKRWQLASAAVLTLIAGDLLVYLHDTSSGPAPARPGSPAASHPRGAFRPPPAAPVAAGPEPDAGQQRRAAGLPEAPDSTRADAAAVSTPERSRQEAAAVSAIVGRTSVFLRAMERGVNAYTERLEGLQRETQQVTSLAQAGLQIHRTLQQAITDDLQQMHQARQFIDRQSVQGCAREPTDNLTAAMRQAELGMRQLADVELTPSPSGRARKNSAEDPMTTGVGSLQLQVPTAATRRLGTANGAMAAALEALKACSLAAESDP